MAEGSTQLDGFRGPDADTDPADRVPALTPDYAEPPAAAAEIVREAAAAVKDPEPDPDPQLVTDPRLEMARRFNERRARDHASAQNIDPNSAPIDAQVPGAAPQDATPPAAAAPDGDTGAAKDRFTLKVNRQEFEATRDQLLAAAELSPEEAEGIPAAALVRIAQKNLAAQARLEEVKTLSQTARLTARADAAPPAHQPPSQDAFPPPSQPDPADDDLVEKIQLGDKDEAKKALNDFFDKREQARSHQARVAQLSTDVNSALEQFARVNPDIANNELAADFLRTASVREAVNELVSKVGISEFEKAQLLNNPELATRAYNGARMLGHDVAPPSEIFTRAGQKVRQAMNMAQPAAPTPQPATGFNSRVEMKRSLPSQPARSGSTQVSAPSSPPAAQERNPSATIAAMRRARFQD